MEKSLKTRRKCLIVVVSVLCIVAVLMGTLCGCRKEEQVPEYDFHGWYDNLVDNDDILPFSSKMTFTSASLLSAKSGGQDGVHVTLVATVYPENAENQNVTWNIDWSSDAPLKNTPVDNYLTGVVDNDNTHKFYVTCKKAFLDNKIIITVRTEEGGFTANCTVSFIGLAENLEVVNSTAPIRSSAKRGQYYSMDKSKSYTFSIGATNSWGVVGATDYEVILGGYGELYFGDELTDENSAHIWRNVTLQSIASRIDKYATASINGNVVTVTMGNYYVEDNESQYSHKYQNGEIEWDEYHTYYYVLDNFYDNSVFNWDTFEKDYDAQALENFDRLESVYFTVTVRDKLSGSSVTIPFFFRVSVEAVYLDNTTANIN